MASRTDIVTSKHFQNSFTLRRHRVAYFVTLKSSKLQPCLLKQLLKTQKKLKELEIMH